jgi:peptide/nickel transport system substrate-binding protein
VFLTAPLQSSGTWNAAHFKNPTYDMLSKQYIATPATDLQGQKTIAGKIETLLLEQTPIIYPYFYNYLTATATNVQGVEPTAIGHLFLFNATKS